MFMNVMTHSTDGDDSNTKYNTFQHPVLKSFIAGSISGLFSTVVFQPFDVVKTVLQNPKNDNKLGLINATKIVWQQESIHGFWRGLSPSLVRNIPGIAIHITLTQSIYSYLTENHQASMVVKSGIAGFSARCITVSVLMPFTVLKTRIESGHFHYVSLIHGLSDIYKFEGWKVLCRGWLSTILRDAPFSAIYFIIFTKLKHFTEFEYWSVVRSIKNSEVSGSKPELSKKQPVYIFGCGLLAGGLASCLTQPFDVIQTSQQISKKKESFFDAIALIKQKHGISGYFKGLSLRILRRSLMASVTWTTYEHFNKM